MVDFVIQNKVVILVALLGVSEVLALIPNIKSSGIFDFVYRSLKTLAGK